MTEPVFWRGNSPVEAVRRFAWSERQDLGIVLVYSSVLGILSLSVPIAIQALVGTVAFGTALQPIFVLTALVTVALFGGAVIRFLEFVVAEYLQRRIFVKSTLQAGRALETSEVSSFDDQNGPDLVNRYFDTFVVQKATADLLINGLGAFLVAVVGMAVLAFYHPLLLAFDALLLVSAYVVLFPLGRGGIESSIQESSAKYDTASWLEQMASNIAVVKQDCSGYVFRRLEQLSSAYLLARASHFRVVVRQLGGALVIQVLATAALLGLGGLLVVQRQLTLGQLVAAEFIVSATISAFAKLTEKVVTFYDMVAALTKLSHLLSVGTEKQGLSMFTPRGYSEREVMQHGLERIAHQVEPVTQAGMSLMNVSMEHQGQEIVSGFSVRLKAGDSLGILCDGRQAHMLSDAMAGFRKFGAGFMTVGGSDARDHRDTVAGCGVHLSRAPGVMIGTVLQNVRLTSPDSTAENVWAALRTLGAEQRFRDLPDGLNTMMKPGTLVTSQTEETVVALLRVMLSREKNVVIDRVFDVAPPHWTEACIRYLEQHGFAAIILTKIPDVAHLAREVRNVGGIHE